MTVDTPVTQSAAPIDGAASNNAQTSQLSKNALKRQLKQQAKEG